MKSLAIESASVHAESKLCSRTWTRFYSFYRCIFNVVFILPYVRRVADQHLILLYSVVAVVVIIIIIISDIVCLSAFVHLCIRSTIHHTTHFH